MDALNFAAAGGTGDVSVQDLDLNGDGLVLTSLTTLKDNIVVDGIQTTGSICLTVLGSDIVIEENLIAGQDVALRTGQDVILGDSAGPDTGVVVAGAGDDLAVGGGDDVTGTISIEAAGSVIDGNGDSTVDTNGDGLADGANFCLLYTSPSPRDLSTSRMPSSA